MQPSRVMSIPRYRMVIALDGSEYAQIVLEHGFDQVARHHEVDLHVLAVVEHERDADGAKAWLASSVLEALATFQAPSDRRTRLHVRVGAPADEIVQLATEVRADLVVIGRFGIHDRRGRLRARLHGKRRSAVADRVVADAPCPVLVVGLTEHPVETPPPCADCAAARERSDGETWFCEAHADGRGVWLSTRIPASLALNHGGLW